MTTMRTQTARHDIEIDNGEPAPISGRRVVTSSGASAAVLDESIEVRDAAGRLIFEYDAATGKGALVVPNGDLTLKAPHGNIDLVAGKSISLGTKQLTMTAERADVTFADMSYRAVRLDAAVEQAHVVLDRIEQVASNVLLRAREVVRHVEGLDHTTAGRVRALIRGAYSLKAERASVLAEDDVKIDGNRVNLG
ncbi:MAG: DUF3540 domain-containing protein [Polyangiaceae bacterium]|nr:DUF3540 domain-containing protein [Polyangiaceae bacterium]